MQVAVQENLLVHQMDVKTAYLNADIDCVIFLEQPEGFVKTNSKGEKLACKLNKSLYGLKQSGRNWYMMLHECLINDNFVQSLSDPCLYTKLDGDSVVIILFLVDDIIIAVSNNQVLNNMKAYLSDRFKMKDMGKLSLFLGIEFTFHDDYAMLSQRRYCEKMLDKFNMSNCKPKSIPCDASVSKVCSDENSRELVNPKGYREIVGSLIHAMTGTRPDLCYAITKLSQFMSKPTQAHLGIAKHVLRYIKGTLHYGLKFNKSNEPLKLFGYCDSDWANSNDRRSISGYGFFMNNGGGLVSWKCKKQILRHSGVQRISGQIPDSTAQVRVGTCGSSNGPTHDSTPHDRLSSFSIHYTNIRGLNSNFSSVEAHLVTSSPNLFLLSETQLSSQSSPDPFQISRYNLYSRFCSKGGVAAYINTPIARLMDLESPHFDVLWLKIYLPTTTIILCFCYCSPNVTDFLSFFEYLTSCHESLLTKHPHAEVLFIGDFNVHHTDWLQSTHTDVGGIEAFHFSISNELEQIIKHPTRVPDRHDHTANTLDLFFTSNPQNYTYTVSSPLGSSDHCTVSVTSSFTPPPPIPPTQRHLWHFENAWRADMSNFLLDFPWNDYCFRTRDPDVAATAVGEVVDSEMRAYIPYSLTAFSPSNPWFDRACSSAISDREGAHRSYQASPSELTHATFISARNHCSAKLRRARSSFRKRKIDKLNSSPTEKCF